MKSILLAALCLVLLTPACKKSKNANELVGAWKLTETTRIGMASWEAVPASGQVVLTFNNDYTYTSVPPAVSSMSGCNGTYRIDPGNLLFMNSSCNLSPAYEEQMRFTREGNALILDYIMTATGIKGKFIKQ
jgi:hypothetical protein